MPTLTKARRVVVTGGAGFIGSHLVDKLVALGKHVTVVDNFFSGKRENLSQHRGSGKVDVREGDVRNLTDLVGAFEGADVVFHLATHCVRLSLTDPLGNHDVNATGTLHALEAARRCAVKRFVYCSSSEVYGNAFLRSGGAKLAEDSRKAPTTVYGASKLVGEHYTLAFHQTHGLPAMVVRPFNTYGPREHLTGPYGEVIPRFCIWIKSGRAPVLFGDGLQTRDFTYVEDTARGLIACADRDDWLGDSVNIARGEEVSIRDLAETLCRLMGRKLTFQYVADRPGDIRRLGADTTKVSAVLPGLFRTSLEEGLKLYLSWLDGLKPDYEALAKALSVQNWIADEGERQKRTA